jgi:flagellar biosynthesis protein FlhB
MSGETDDSQKTEEPTGKKLSDALEKGDVLQSTDIVAWAMLAVATLLAAVWLGGAARDLGKSMTVYLSGAGTVTFDNETMSGLAWRVGGELGAFLALPFAAMLVVAIGAHLLQRPFVFNPEKVAPHFEKLNPVNGLNRLFGRQALIQFAKGLLKIGFVSLAAFWVIWPERARLPTLIDLPLNASLNLVYDLLLTVLMITLIVYGVIAVFDFAYQYWERMQRLMMSHQEIKDEFKQSEGDPHVKGRLRQIRHEKARQRMMSAVPAASVVVTNPTHYAVAIKYENGMGAPIVVAKGVELIALKIREIATANNVPIVENPPLARALYATVDIDEAVRPEHYKAVAQVIGYVMRLKGKLKAARSERPAGP